MADALHVASVLLATVVREGGTRHVAAATASALWRLMVTGKRDNVEEEVESRMAAIQPWIRGKVSAANDGSCAVISGAARAARNVVTHDYTVSFVDIPCHTTQQRGSKLRASPIQMASYCTTSTSNIFCERNTETAHMATPHEICTSCAVPPNMVPVAFGHWQQQARLAVALSPTHLGADGRGALPFSEEIVVVVKSICREEFLEIQ